MPGLRRVLSRLRHGRAADADRSDANDGTYGGNYFGEGRDPLSRMGLSGYERYSRESSNADLAAYLLWRFFPVRKSFDCGCATGFVVEALSELGIDAHGSDVSSWAVEHAARGARGRISVGDLTAGLAQSAGSADMVTALETLEHIPTDLVPTAIGELARVTSAWVVCTIPSIGANDHGPDGFPNSKVLDHRLEAYLALGRDYDGPVPFDDLAVDANGAPIEGHVSIASYRWWTARFAECGLERCGEMEHRMHPVLARLGLTEFWNLYVFRRPGTELPPVGLRTAEEIREIEQRWNLADRRAPERALEFLEGGLGPDAVVAARAEPPYPH